MTSVDPQTSRPEAAPGGFWTNILRPKGNLSRRETSVLVLVAMVPLVMVIIRITALPGVVNPALYGTALDIVRSLGSTLNQTFSLASVPPDQRDRVLYLLFLPTCALLLAVARLTLGIRVLGFRAILLSVGFQATGILPSLVLIGLVVLVIVLVRPHLKRIRLPAYARLSVILGIVVMTLVAALLAAPWIRSEAVWKTAFFPVLVLGLLAEGIAKMLDHDNMLTASWRAGTTIVIAFLIALLCRVPAFREIALLFPELVLTQIICVVLISEYLDLRLFEDWDSRLAGMALPRLFSDDRAYRVAVVRNRRSNGIIGRLGQAAPKRYARRKVQPIIDALREGGHTVRVLEGDMSLLSELDDFMPPHPQTGQPGGIVFNLAHGVQGETRYAHVPAMLEMAGVAYTGPTPMGHALSRDSVAAKTLLHRAGVLTPPFCVMAEPGDGAESLRYPLTVRPRYETSKYGGRIADDRQELDAAVDDVVRRHRQEAVVEEYVAGRFLDMALLGNDPVECLPIVDLGSTKGEMICPAPIDENLAQRIRAAALTAFQACQCRDFARVEFRLADSGEPYVLDIRSIGVLERRGSFVRAAAQADYTFNDVVCRIVEVARGRYRPGASPSALSTRAKTTIGSQGPSAPPARERAPAEVFPLPGAGTEPVPEEPPTSKKARRRSRR